MKIAQIGVGGWGKNHARILSQLGVLVAVCDADEIKAKDTAQKYNVRHYSSLDTMLNSEQIDAVFVCTPTVTHFDIASKIIQSKKSVFVEKPMTYKSEEGMKLTELAKKNGVILTCGYIERFNPAVETVKEFVKSDRKSTRLNSSHIPLSRMPSSA